MPRARSGVVAASAGNHGQAVAWAAREVGHPGHDLHARGGSDGEGGGDHRLRRRGRARRRELRSRRRRCAGARRADGREARTRVRGSARRRGTRHDRARARRAGSRGRDDAHPGWRRGPRGGDLPRAPRPRSRAADRRRHLPARAHDRGRHLGQAARRARVLDPRAHPRRHGRGLGRGDHGRARPLPRAQEARARGCRGRRVGGSPGRPRRWLGPGRGRPIGRERRRDHAHLRRPARPDAGRAATWPFAC